MNRKALFVLLGLVTVFEGKTTLGFLVPTVSTTCDPSCVSHSLGDGSNVTCVCPSTDTQATTKHATSNHTSSIYPSLSTVLANSSTTETGCVKVMSRDGTLTGSDLSAGSPFHDDCRYLIDLGESFLSGQKYIKVTFERLNLEECMDCSCDYLQFENSEFSQRICSNKNVQINRQYKLTPTSKERFLGFHFHKHNTSMLTDFRLHYTVEWGNSTNVCEAVTCKTRCPHGLLQDFVGCPMCSCAGPCTGNKTSMIMNTLLEIQNKSKILQDKVAEALQQL